MQASPKVNERSINAATESAETEQFSNDKNPHLPPLVQDQEEEEEEFSFLCTNPSGSLISADDIFQNGQIRPVFPLFNRDGAAAAAAAGGGGGPLMFVEERSEADGPSCVWTGGSKALPDQQMCKKSNSTGSSKLRRFREFVLRSNSDGKDAFVFLNHKDSTSKHLQETAAAAATSEMIGHEKTTAKKEVGVFVVSTRTALPKEQSDQGWGETKIIFAIPAGYLWFFH
ncbi:histone [Salix suchowensis]|nr:histone [Salix suchowensis]